MNWHMPLAGHCWQQHQSCSTLPWSSMANGLRLRSGTVSLAPACAMHSSRSPCIPQAHLCALQDSSPGSGILCRHQLPRLRGCGVQGCAGCLLHLGLARRLVWTRRIVSFRGQNVQSMQLPGGRTAPRGRQMSCQAASLAGLLLHDSPRASATPTRLVSAVCETNVWRTWHPGIISQQAVHGGLCCGCCHPGPQQRRQHSQLQHQGAFQDRCCQALRPVSGDGSSCTRRRCSQGGAAAASLSGSTAVLAQHILTH